MQQSEQHSNMLTTPAEGSTEQYIDRLSAFFDDAVQSASDDELFAQGYLRGHVDLAIGQLQVQGEPFVIADIVRLVDTSLTDAVAGGELNDQDKTLVLSLWQQLN
jgi:hypothetical protein